MLDIKEIVLGSHMTKYHFQQPGIPAMHKFTSADPDGDFHDHPFGMTSLVLYGGYVEEILDPTTGVTWRMTRERKDSRAHHSLPVSSSFYIPAKRIHRMTELIGGECWTITLPHEYEQEWSFWRVRDGVVERRRHDSDEWVCA